MIKQIMVVLAGTAAGLGMMFYFSQIGTPIVADQATDQSSGNLMDQIIPGADPNSQDRLGPAIRARIQRTDPKTGRLIQEYFFDQLEPRESGVFDITRPEARLIISDNLVIHLQSELGYVEAPGNYPRSGEFRKDLVVTIYRCAPDQTLIEGPDSPHIMMTIHMDEAKFDTRLGEVRSDGKVAIKTEQGEFRGTGLIMVYNQVNNRIDYLEITKGESLVYHTKAPGWDDDLKKDDQANNSRSGNQTRPSSVTAEASEEFIQYYRLTFENDIELRNGKRWMHSDRLTIYFAFDRDSRGLPALNMKSAMAPMDQFQPPGIPSRMPLTIGRTLNPIPLMLAAPTTTSPAAPTSSGGQSIDFLPNTSATATQANERAELELKDDVILKWSGKMIMEPQNDPPDDITNSKDIFLQFDGAPVTMGIDGDKNVKAISCAAVAYKDATQTIVASGNAQFPVWVNAPTLGNVKAAAMVMKLNSERAILYGPGTIRAITPAAKKRGQLEPNFAIHWGKQLDLVMDESQSRRNAGLGWLRQATFRGQVRIEDNRFHMQGDQLDVRLTGGGDTNVQQVEAIDAVGNVKVAAEGWLIEGGRLTVHSTPQADGKLHPSRLVAVGDVTVREARQTLVCNGLEVRFSTVDENAPRNRLRSLAGNSQGPDSDLPPVRLKTLEASQDIRLQFANGMIVFSDKIQADAITRKATVFGSPVRVIRGNSELRVLDLNLEDDGKIAYTESGGEFFSREPQADRKEREHTFHVKWSGSCQYHESTNLIQLHGKVLAQASDAPNEVNQLAADQLTLQLVDRSIAKEIQGNDPEADPSDPLNGKFLMLKRMTARQNVSMLASRWKTGERKALVNRLRIAGPLLVFDNVVERAQVVGAGSMMIEDYRPEPKKQRTAALPMSGRGVTYFTWAKNMILDAGQTRLSMDSQVRMTHQSQGNNELMELRAETLIADMRDVGGLKSLRMSQSKPLDIEFIEATGGVMITDPRRQISAHKIRYEGAWQKVTMVAQPGRTVTVARTDQARPIRAGSLVWDLKNDRLEVKRVNF